MSSTAALLARLVVSLAIVLGLMAACAWVLRKRGTLGRLTGGGALAVLARQPLGRNASVAVVRVGERALVIGVTEQSVTLLGESDAASFAPDVDEPGTALSEAAATPPQRTRTSFVDALRELTVRR